MPFKPGFVGGHCIRIDPYYFIFKGHSLGKETKLISMARSVNEGMLDYIFSIILKKFKKMNVAIQGANIAILGMSYKEDVTDMRNSVPVELYQKLKKSNANVVAYDPTNNDKFDNTALDEIADQTIILICVAHREFNELGFKNIANKIKKGGVLMDMPGLFFSSKENQNDFEYWSL